MSYTLAFKEVCGDPVVIYCDTSTSYDFDIKQLKQVHSRNLALQAQTVNVGGKGKRNIVYDYTCYTSLAHFVYDEYCDYNSSLIKGAARRIKTCRTILPQYQ